MRKIRLLILFSLIICCLFAVCSCDGTKALPKPEKVEVDEATLVLNWKTVKGARMYTISIVSESGDVKEVISSKNSYSLSSLGVGKYTIKVMANGKDGVSKDSPWSAAREFEREAEPGMVFTLINGGTEYEVSGKGIATGDIVIPERYRGKPVTAIGKKAFFNKSDVDTVTLHDGIKSIGDFAFSNCSYLTAVNIPAGLTHIGENAFSGCRALESRIVIPDGVTEIPASAFAYCSMLSGVTLGRKVETVGKNAFSDCASLEEIVIPDSVKALGEYAFSNCESVRTLTVGVGLITLGDYAFSGMPLLESATLGDALKTIGEGAFFKCSGLNSVTIGEGIESIGLSAFEKTPVWENSPTNEIYVGKWFLGLKDTSVSYVLVADGTVGIANYALSSNKNVTSVDLPNTVKRIGACAFARANVSYVVIGSGVEVIGQQAFDGCENLSTVILGSCDYELGTLVESSLKTIDSYAFRDCVSLKNIVIPSSVKSIGSYVFRDSALYNNSYTGVVYADKWVVDFNENLGMEVAIEEGTVGIANYAFYKCKQLTSVSVPSSVELIGRAAFYQCTNLTSVTLPETLEVIDDFTFYHCDSLKLFNLPPMLKSIGRSAFYKCGTVYTEVDADTAFDTLVIPSGVSFIGEYAFYGCGSKTVASLDDENAKPTYKGIDIIILGDSIKVIEAHAFHGFVSLREVVLGSGVEVISDRAFYQCESLEKVSFGSSLKKIGSRAFYKCDKLKAVKLPSTLTTVGEYAFYKCTSVSEVELGGAVTVEKYAFYGLSAVKEISLPKTLTSIGKQAFRGCSSLTGVIIPNSVTSIDKHAFYGCSSLTVYTEYSSAPDGFVKYWNSSYRPIVWGCTLSENKDYVVSFEKKDGGISYKNDSNVISAPIKAGYVFVGWTSIHGSTVAEYTAEEIYSAENGRVYYAVYDEIPVYEEASVG